MWTAITHPVQTLENALAQWGTHSQFGYKVIKGLADFTAGLNDAERNPVTAAFGQSLWNGWAGLSYGVRSTVDLALKTGSALLKGDWERVKRYGGAWLEGTVKGWIWGGIQALGHLAWGAVKSLTPIGLFETGPTWWQAIKDRWAGKRGGWDVAFTSLLLIGNLLGIYGGTNGVRVANEFRTFPETLSPAAQTRYVSLSTAEQIRVFNAARSTGASPGAVEFYLEQTARPGSALAKLPLAEGLRVSSFAEQGIQSPQAPAAMIGKYYEKSPISYERLGQDLGFTHLNLPGSLYDEFLLRYGKDAWWPYVNEPFVWKVAMQRKPVYVNVDPARVLSGGNLYAELQALHQFGYTEGGTEILNGIELWKLVPGP